ncbi:SWIM zinc finger family protein [Streptomyces sp. H27-D2]|uniref:SWIM zinc finger family protein n=1 Tax=Streptomyces sp. H27-D2 TaxID=3046304 RepID=UPI002DBFBE9E|nr:SWIM zinc finger family protein [Streptomyces sp. H27-D2]MEC4015989.1 SWIM zinc finger family protein [Streptomyces sp. H27-D2]
MTQQGERWTADQVLALSPDAASRKAGSRLAAPGPWSGAGTGDGAVWGLCAGSGSKPYQTVIDTTGPGYKCSCPSRKFPCKHALALLLLWAGEGESGGEQAVRAGEPPEWAAGWIDQRRERADRKEAAPAAGSDSGGAGPEAARRRSEQRAQRIAAGATELEQRLADLVRGGLASADQAGYALWDEAAARMVDAKAPGLASRLRELGSVPSSGAGWPARLLEECALIHLLDQGFLGLDRLPEPLAATVRSRVGITMEAAELLAAPDRTVRDDWLVLAQQDTQDGKLTTRRIWLRGRESGRIALLLSFGAAGRAPELALPTGLSLDADLAYYPGARPLRAALGQRHTAPAPGTQPPGVTLDAALASYGEALRDDPWLDAWPVVLSDVIPIPGPDGWQLASEIADAALPVDPRSLGRAGGLWQLAAVSGGAPITVFGECGHRGFMPLTTWAPEPVRL